MKILISGCNGYIGKHVCHYASSIGLDVITVSRGENIFQYSNYHKIDLLENAENQNLFNELGRPNVFIHLAYNDGFSHNADSHLKDLYKHFCLIKNMVNHGCNSISVMGTMHEIGFYEGIVDETTQCHPMNFYGIAKNALRESLINYLKDKKCFFKWLRAFYITGDDKNNHSIFSKILHMEEEKKEFFPFTDGLNKYDFIDVDILAKQIVLASIQNEYNGIINVCSGKPQSLKDAVNNFIKNNNLQIRPEYGAFPSRPYDSRIIYGNNEIIEKIMQQNDE